jgi:hypothetical protein
MRCFARRWGAARTPRLRSPRFNPAISARPGRSRKTRSAPSAISMTLCAQPHQRARRLSARHLRGQPGFGGAAHLSRIPPAHPRSCLPGNFSGEPDGRHRRARPLEPLLVFPIIDLLLGGVGRMQEQERDITEIGEGIMEGVVRILCAELQTAGLRWAQVLNSMSGFSPRSCSALCLPARRPSV